jgi:spermidine synthase
MSDTPYSLVTISVLCLLFYGVTLALVRFGIISDAWQRKFWNTLLLLSILVAGCIGLFLAITVNFKINFSLTDTFLVWHVDFGIALFVIAVFHFSWHIKYYRFLFSPGSKSSETYHEPFSGIPSGQTGNKLGFNLKRLPFSLGFTAMATQLILLRELLSVFNGNELTIGIVLANWMLLTGIGAYINRKSNDPIGLKGIMSGLFILAFIPALTLLLLNWLRNIVLPVGGLPGMGLIMISTGILLAPFCLLSGWLFSSVSNYLSKSLNENAISLTYGLETLGSIAAGILCSMTLVFLFEPFQNIAIILLINSVILFMASRNEIFRIRKNFKLYLSVAVLITSVSIVLNLDKTALQFLFPEQEIVFFKDTPYGKLVVTDKAGQLNFFENNTLLFTTNNITTNEETVHYALLQRPVTGNILLVGGGISGVAEECLKYPLKRLDCVEMNPRIQKLGKKLNRLSNDKRFTIYSGDPRMLIRNALDERYQMHSEGNSSQKKIDSLEYQSIILNLPEPSTLQINRFYTLEFFRMCKNLLTLQGIMSLSLISTSDYVGNDALKIQSTIYQTLKAVFKNVLVIPGEKNYFLASDGALTAAVSMLAAKQGIATEYVNEYFLDDISLKERSDKIMKRISVKAPLNKDFEPVGCYRQLNYWLSYPGNTGIYIIIFPVILLLIIAGFRGRGITVSMFTAGLSSFSLEIILILTFQVIYGYVYLMTGVFITLFMTGLYLGVLLAKRFPKRASYNSLIYLQLESLILVLLSLACIYFFRQFQISTVLIHLLFSTLIISIATVTGAQFHFASVLKAGDIQKVAATNYSADLLGSATGALLINALIVPFLGLTVSLWVVAGFGALTILLMLVKKRT